MQAFLRKVMNALLHDEELTGRCLISDDYLVENTSGELSRRLKVVHRGHHFHAQFFDPESRCRTGKLPLGNVNVRIFLRIRSLVVPRRDLLDVGKILQPSAQRKPVADQDPFQVSMQKPPYVP